MHSVLIHEYYSRFDHNAVFVTVNTTLRSNHLDIRAYVRSKVGLPNQTEGVIFTPYRATWCTLNPRGWA